MGRTMAENGVKGSKKSVKFLGKEEERALARRDRQGDRAARRRLLQAYEPLVAREARKWLQWNGDSQEPFWEDLLQEGRIALIEALDRFDPERGLRLSTFAMWRIKHAVAAYAHTFGGPVATAKNVAEKRVFHNFSALRAEIERETGRPLDDAGRRQIAETLNVKVQMVIRVEQRLQGEDLSLESPVSQRAEEDSKSTVQGDLIADGRPAPEAEVGRREYAELAEQVIADALSGLPERVAYVLKARWLSDRAKQPSLQTVANELGLGREQTRILERRGQDALRDAMKKAGLAASSWDAPDSAPTLRPQTVPTRPPGRGRGDQSGFGGLEPTAVGAPAKTPAWTAEAAGQRVMA